jgi:peptidoglycan-N-acetylglucosamine deacetylase
MDSRKWNVAALFSKIGNEKKAKLKIKRADMFGRIFIITSVFVCVFWCARADVVMADTTNKPQPVKVNMNGDYSLKAFYGKGLGPAIKYMPEWEAFGWFTAEDSVVWDVDIKEEGVYDVYLTWSVSDEEAGKKFTFNIGDQAISGVVSKSGSWETFKSDLIGSVRLREGQKKAVFKPFEKFTGEALLDLRELRLVPKK